MASHPGTCASQSQGSQPTEDTPLFVPEKPVIYTYELNPAVKWVTRVFNFLCSLTGQYIYPGLDSNKKMFCCFTTIVLLPFSLNILLNGFIVGYDIYDIVFCKANENCSFFFIYSLPHLYDYSKISIVNPPTADEFFDWEKLLMTTATVSGVLSFFFMACVLYGRYSCCIEYVNPDTGRYRFFDTVIARYTPEHHRRYFNCAKGNVLIIHPFKNDKYTDRQILIREPRFLSSLITPLQSFYFYFLFFLNILIFLAAVGLITYILVRHYSSTTSTFEVLDILGLFGHFFSQFSAILSCFIFSKVAYAVTNHCFDFGHCIFHCVAEESNERNCLSKLIETDQKYCMLLKNSLRPYGAWFAVHWLLYTVTSFMSIAYVADQIIIDLYGTEPGDKNCHSYLDLDCRLKLAYSIFFAFQHCILFIYPCFRAASVTRARSNMIKYVSNLDLPNITNQDKHAFLSYLKDQNASFKISILCAELPFGFSLAILSLFIGILGVVMKLSV